jgi:hypothetical protein
VKSIQINQNRTMVEILAIQQMAGIMESHIQMKKAQILGCWCLFALLDLSFSKH